MVPTPRDRPPQPPAAVAAPVTPVKVKENGGDPGRGHVAKLNGIYNLGVPFAEGSPADKARKGRVDAHFGRHSRITDLLRFLHYRGPDRLQAVLDDFDAKVCDQNANWVRKTRVTRSVLPSSKMDNAPRAQGLEDQIAMQELLLSLLEASRDVLLQPVTSPTRRPPPPAMAVLDVNAPVHDAQLAADIDRVPVVSRFGLPVVRTRPEPDVVERQDIDVFVPEDNRPRSSGGSSTSSSMYSALDSFEGPVDGYFDSQTTVGADAEPDKDEGNETEVFSDEEYSPAPLRRPPSQESFAASDDVLEALDESFGLYDITDVQKPNSPSSTAYSSIPEMEDLQLSEEEYSDAPGEPQPGPPHPVPGLWDRLSGVFPPTPEWLKKAPFAIIWETTRIALLSGVKLKDIDLKYSPTWEDQATFRDALQQHPKFAGKRFPEQSTQVAWDSALNEHTSYGGTKRVVVYTILMGFNKNTSGPLYSVHLQPLSIDLPHRLSRHFGSDRYLEILMPSHHSSQRLVPHILHKQDEAVREVNHWIARQRHEFAGRTWAAFYVTKDGFKKIPVTSRSRPGEAEEVILLNRVYLFAEDGVGLSPSSQPAAAASMGAGVGDGPVSAPAQVASPLRVHQMLDWLLQCNKYPGNRKQPYLKLFSRIALGLSRTRATVVFEPSQIIHHEKDLLSPTGVVMNDGVARMSLSVARKLRSALELSDLPVAVQGRIGSAKGMWILDTEDIGREDWIETYPAQRKWQCDGLDAGHRTLEICTYASEARSASLNLQFISLLEDRAIDKARVRRVLGGILEGGLTRDLAEQREALESPLLFASWAYENAQYRKDHVVHCQVPFLGGLPDRDEDAIQFLLAGGFDPLSQRFLWEMAYKMQKQRCEKLSERLSIRVGRTAYMLMVVDFMGVLEEGEVQVCFSSKFQVEPDSEPDEHGDDGSFSDTLLVGTDVLVARVPAHFTSDMQKVRAVFRQELCALKDVIVFSSKGNSPLADKLSGGDYDGDLAWVCWDPRIVSNFENAPLPPKYDLVEMGYMRKIRTTLDQLTAPAPGAGGDADLPPPVMADMIERSFAFNTRENLLGRLTVYKEGLCYMRGSIGDKTANLLSTLLSDLVDQAKQGNDFTDKDLDRLRVELLEGLQEGSPAPKRLDKPAYKCTSRSARAKKMDHIIDFLKFDVAEPIIQRELRALSDMREVMCNRDNAAGERHDNSYWDADLAEPAKDFEALAAKSAVCNEIFETLKSDILAVHASWQEEIKEWGQGSGNRGNAFDDPGYRQRFLQVYQQWCDITVRLPTMSANASSTAVAGSPATGSPASRLRKKAPLLKELDAGAETIPQILQQGYLADPEYSHWALIRASQAFRMLYRRSIVWKLAGRQLQVIKALMSGGGGGGASKKSNIGGGLSGARVLTTPMTFAAMRPDRKIIKRMAARLQGAEVEGIDYVDDDNQFGDDT
ncbi:RNA-dependent RNA polymerase [Sporothrix schenckii 1099-18]|uniref:RNA-dependent RNA polymerase n=1 Tax=Sporothrix schenckii 1099-18 TaxID=1397361 RepID=A0A0F2LXD0_SPOSC|nr:RNA-dependent RNA polymerase [Sporothrix schenckii 1099-18]KJR81489.1 RNA-dependent RNA polymerase [Sporothrix schenckii 1099-18]